VYFHDWPDVTIHTNKDQPENLDSTKLGRVSYLGAGIAWTLAALPESGTSALLSLTRAAVEEQIAQGRLAARLDDGRDGSLKLRESVRSAVATLASLEALWPSTEREVRGLQTTLLTQVPPVPPATTHDDRIPVRNPEIRGPLSVYYYDHLKEVLGEDTNTQVGLAAGDDVIAYEALNLVDGRRSLSEIRDVLSGLYQPVSAGDVGAYFELLERAHVVRFR